MVGILGCEGRAVNAAKFSLFGNAGPSFMRYERSGDDQVIVRGAEWGGVR